ncbi:MAG: 3,4-dihydroxy-2-butanone-4-phosphate synthase [Pseudomonadota bacterium]
MELNTVEEILEDIRQGKMVILMDDEDRENEGDLIMAAEKVRPEDINFMATEACGLICLTMTPDRARQIDLSLMVQKNTSQHETNFTSSINASSGIGSGVSAADRATTVQKAIAPDAKPEDVVQPGYIFPLIARPGGVLTRAGHTEAGCDLARMAGFRPASVIIEIMNEDGTMARRPQLEVFARKHNLKLGTIADLIRYRAVHDQTVTCVEQKMVSTQHGDFEMHVYQDEIGEDVHIAMKVGDIQPEEPCMARVQSLNTLRDVIETQLPNNPGSWSLRAAQQRIAEEGKGVLVLLGNREDTEDILSHIQNFPVSRGESTPLSERGMSIYRMVGVGSQILKDLGVGKMRLLGSPMRYNAISGFGLEIVEFVES